MKYPSTSESVPVSIWSVRPRTFGCVAMGSALLFIVRSRLLIYSAGSGVNRVQVVLSGFSKRLFCLEVTNPMCRYAVRGMYMLVMRNSVLAIAIRRC